MKREREGGSKGMERERGRKGMKREREGIKV